MSSAAVGGSKISETNNLITCNANNEIFKNEYGNMRFSPLSGRAILRLLYCGTEGDSAQELAKNLPLSGSKEEIQNDTKRLLDTLQSESDAVFEFATAAFVQENLTLKEPFLNVARDYFFAETKILDFSKSQEAADTVNRFVEDHTNNFIKNLVNRDSLSAATTLVLVDALRFKGNWSIPFSPLNTKKESFHTPDGTIQVDTLYHYKERFGYYYDADLKTKFLKLSFSGIKASMILVIPTEKGALPLLVKNFAIIATCKIPFKSTYLKVALPKFKFECKIDFKQILTQLGVSKIFDHSQADLSGIAGDKGQVVVSEVVQKVYIDLNEVGVEAAAATYVLNSVELPAVENEPNNFIANEPFIFFLKIRDTTIFAGRIVEPKC